MPWFEYEQKTAPRALVYGRGVLCQSAEHNHAADGYDGVFEACFVLSPCMQ